MAAVAFPEEITRRRPPGRKGGQRKGAQREGAERTRAQSSGTRPARGALHLVEPPVERTTQGFSETGLVDAAEDEFAGLAVPSPPVTREWAPRPPSPGVWISVQPLLEEEVRSAYEGSTGAWALQPVPPFERRHHRMPVRSGTVAGHAPARRVASSRVIAIRRWAVCALLAGLGYGALVGANAVARQHGQAPAVLAGSVRVQGGYEYTVQPGDTLWSIASRVYPNGDPRSLVASLESRLGGAGVLPGDRLLLP